jgi:tetratricopeptide (TPR) repeat protein
LVDAPFDDAMPKYWKWAAGLTGFVVLIMTYFLINNNWQQQTQTVTQFPAAEPRVKKILTAQELARIGRMLEVAEIHQLVGRYSEPRGANAMDAYNQILEIDPYNSKAKQGLQDIANYYEQRAKELLQQGNLDVTKKHIERGLLAYPSDPELLQLKKKLDTENE